MKRRWSQSDSFMDRCADRICVGYGGSCWVWLGGQGKQGYGQLRWRGSSSMGAHRVAYEELRGPVPNGLHLDHLCRNRLCVNPDHLEPVTPVVNILRGFGAHAQNARKTHCKRGHEFTPENTYLIAGGGRACRACWRANPDKSRLYRRAYKDRKRAAARAARTEVHAHQQA